MTGIERGVAIQKNVPSFAVQASCTYQRLYNLISYTILCMLYSSIGPS